MRQSLLDMFVLLGTKPTRKNMSVTLFRLKDKEGKGSGKLQAIQEPLS